MNRRHILQAALAGPVVAMAHPPNADRAIVEIPDGHDLWVFLNSKLLPLFVDDPNRFRIDFNGDLQMWRHPLEPYSPFGIIAPLGWSHLCIVPRSMDLVSWWEGNGPTACYHNPRFLHPSVSERLVKA